MGKKIQFTKMHGAGNDYIYVDAMRYPIACPEQAAEIWSRAHTGIGSDGLVLIDRADDPADADFKMRIFNADGSEAMMCGNASRCIGKYLYEKGYTKSQRIRLQTRSGVKILELSVKEENGVQQVEQVRVDMLAPVFHSPQYDTAHATAAHLEEIGRMARAQAMQFVSMGNPHFVLFLDEAQNIEDYPIEEVGRRLEYDPMFPERCNIEFARAAGKNQWRTRVWERGSGVTQACGTGACATAVAALQLGMGEGTQQIHMDGGTLTIEWQENGHVMLSGPAAFVFDGEIALP